jgi:NitT/TauT family transport system substrate-binding protein
MARMQTRRGFLGGIAAAGATSLIRTRWAEAADGPLETTTVRIQKPGSDCVSSLYIAEELLRSEGFTEIRYADPPYPGAIGPVINGDVDFSPAYASQCVRAIDAGEPLMLLAGIMVGCFELFAREGIASVAELKGKSVGVGALARAADLDHSTGRARLQERRSMGHRPQGKADRIVRAR